MEADQRIDKLEQQVNQVWTRTPDGIGWQDLHGRWSGRLFGRLQFDHRSYDPSGMVPSGFSMRRIRLGAEVTYDKYYGFFLEGEYATGNASTTTQTASLVSGYLLLTGSVPTPQSLWGSSNPSSAWRTPDRTT